MMLFFLSGREGDEFVVFRKVGGNYVELRWWLCNVKLVSV